MNGIQICVRGWVGGPPTLHVGTSGARMARFRLGVTPRRFDRVAKEFRDAPTEWFSIKAWNDMAENVCESLDKGIPVVVRGYLSTESWTTDGQEHSTSVIRADSIGVDLANGTAAFTRVVRNSGQAEPAGAAGPDGDDAPGPGTLRSGVDQWEVTAVLDPDGAEPGLDGAEPGLDGAVTEPEDELVVTTG